MNRRQALVAVASACGWASIAARAQPANRTARVGWLGWSPGSVGNAPSRALQGLRLGLEERGWREGKNLTVTAVYGVVGQAAALATELLAANADVIVAHGPMIFGARNATTTAPLLFGINGDPVEAGLVSSLARPGANITGLTALALVLDAKRVELLKEVQPGLARIAVLANAGHPGTQSELRETRAAAARLGLALDYVPIRSAADVAPALVSIKEHGAQGLVSFPDTLINAQAHVIAEFCTAQRLPSVSGWAEFAEAGNLMSYGPALLGFWSHLAKYVDKVLKGARAGELPVEEPTVFELVVNMKAARALGVSIPSSLLLRANRVIQ